MIIRSYCHESIGFAIQFKIQRLAGNERKMIRMEGGGCSQEVYGVMWSLEGETLVKSEHLNVQLGKKEE